MKESILYYTLKCFGWFVRILPLTLALELGKFIGAMAYYFDFKHRTQAYSNMRLAFEGEKSFDEINKTTKKLFMNFGQNIVELLRMPLLNRENFTKHIEIEGQEYIEQSFEQGKGVILLAMHFGSWEMASVSCAILGYPYKVFVKLQEKYSRLNELLNSYRTCGGSVVLNRGAGTRDVIKSLKNNEAIGMVVDQGGRDGMLVPFFGREATMSVGALRLALKQGTPVCFSVIIRKKGRAHKLIIEKPLELINTGDLQKDLNQNLRQIATLMEKYIKKYPHEYMWFYKIWKYSNESKIVILSDGKVGHLRQSECIALQIKRALKERGIISQQKVLTLSFKNESRYRVFSLLSFFMHPIVFQGQLGILKWFLSEDSYKQVMSVKADFIVSCGSSVAGLNYLLANDQNAKSIVNLTPGILGRARFDMAVFPKHDAVGMSNLPDIVAVTQGAPNLIDKEYIKEKTEKLLLRYSHLQSKVRFKIGIFIGGNSKNIILTEQQVNMLLRQISEVAAELNANIMITTSRRTPKNIENLIKKEAKNNSQYILSVIASDQDVPEAVGGIIGLSDIVVISGDSISMVSEVACSGKQTIVFLPKFIGSANKVTNKHRRFIKSLDKQGYILSTSVKNVGHTIFDVAKNKMKTRKLDNNAAIFNAAKKVI